MTIGADGPSQATEVAVRSGDDMVPVEVGSTFNDSDGRLSAGRSLLAGRLALLIAVLLVWEFASGRVVDEFFISSPSAIFGQLTNLFYGETGFADAPIWVHLRVTLWAALVGYFYGAIIAIVLGFVLGRLEILAKIVDPFIIMIYSIPKVALAPLFILWFGIGILPKIVLAALSVFFMVFYNTYSGVRDVDADLVDAVRIMGAGEWGVFRRVTLPSSLSWIFVGLKLGVPYALVGVIVGEIVASNRGLGYLVSSAAGYFNTAGVFAALAVLVAVSASLNAIVGHSERLLIRWK